ncbi:hypothetical protein FOMPIDRAFT_1049558 [Fomitopsis schrenkii]|uniref:Uncharacterized protein n=1 Tax=Fomitopsis schrenkii TaxID=2126942 RepID=S8FGH5_FOMSC|nr:hypothetical protein FOMPIDRAFT_1049558 [Fomitopsis schrenkii]
MPRYAAYTRSMMTASGTACSPGRQRGGYQLCTKYVEKLLEILNVSGDEELKSTLQRSRLPKPHAVV